MMNKESKELIKIAKTILAQPTIQKYQYSASGVHYIPLIDGRPILTGLRFTKKQNAQLFLDEFLKDGCRDRTTCRSLAKKYKAVFI